MDGCCLVARHFRVRVRVRVRVRLGLGREHLEVVGPLPGRGRALGVRGVLHAAHLQCPAARRAELAVALHAVVHRLLHELAHASVVVALVEGYDRAHA